MQPDNSKIKNSLKQNENKPQYSRFHPDQRKYELVQATLRLIASNGVRAATVRAIAKEAGVTQGLIRHYFSSKEELISCAFEHHMSGMIYDIEQSAGSVRCNAVERLGRFIRSSLSPVAMEPEAVALWAGLFHWVQHDNRMRETHQKTYLMYRDRIENLIKEALQEVGNPASQSALRSYAIASNAVIDGLWLEGGALPDAFDEGELADIGLKTIGALLDIELASAREAQ